MNIDYSIIIIIVQQSCNNIDNIWIPYCKISLGGHRALQLCFQLPEPV